MKEPGYRRSKGRGRRDRAFVELNGTHVYLGPYGSDESYERYHRILAEWRGSGCRLPAPKEEITVSELLAHFWDHAEVYYGASSGYPSIEKSRESSEKPLGRGIAADYLLVLTSDFRSRAP